MLTIHSPLCVSSSLCLCNFVFSTSLKPFILIIHASMVVALLFMYSGFVEFHIFFNFLFLLFFRLYKHHFCCIVFRFLNFFIFSLKFIAFVDIIINLYFSVLQCFRFPFPIFDIHCFNFLRSYRCLSLTNADFSNCYFYFLILLTFLFWLLHISLL